MSAQLRKMIFAGCRQLGLDEDTRRDLQLGATGKASLTDMTTTDLRAVVDALKARGFDATPGRPNARKPSDRADVRFCHVMWRLLAEKGAIAVPGPDGLNAFIRARFSAKWGAAPIDIDRMSDWQQISAVVRALKDMCRRADIPVT